MADDIQQFKIDFETNAKQAAAHLREVVELLQKISNQIDRNFALRLSRMKKSRALQKGEIDMTKKRVKAETDANKKISDAAKKVGKTEKANADTSRRNETQELVRLGKIAAAWGIINHLAQKAYAKNKEFASISWAAQMANVPTNQVIALKSAGSGEGVDYQSSGNALTQMRRASSMMKRGLMPFAEANARFTQQVQDVLFSNGKMTNDPMEMLRRIAGAMDTIRDVGDKMYFGELMGLSADMTRFLSKGLANFDKQIADGIKNSPELARMIDEAQARQKKLDDLRQGMSTLDAFALKILDFLPNDPQVLKNIGVGISALVKAVTAIYVAVLASSGVKSLLQMAGALFGGGALTGAAGLGAASLGVLAGKSIGEMIDWINNEIRSDEEKYPGLREQNIKEENQHEILDYNLNTLPYSVPMGPLGMIPRMPPNLSPSSSPINNVEIHIPLTVYGDNPQQVADAVKNGLDRALTMWDIASVDAMYSRGDKA